jgi:hypothetical protein
MLTLYVRTLIQSYQMIIISSCREIRDFNTNDDYTILSLTASFVTFFVCVGLIGLMIQQWWKSRNPESFETQKYFIEIFSSLKDNWKSRSYNILNYGRRSLLVALVIFAKNVNVYAVTSIFSVIQFIY